MGLDLRILSPPYIRLEKLSFHAGRFDRELPHGSVLLARDGRDDIGFLATDIAKVVRAAPEALVIPNPPIPSPI